MNILIIDAQGGGIGRQLVAAIRERLPEASLTAVGTNSAATSAMLKAGATQAATGENAVVVSSRRADVIIGPIGIVIADALLGRSRRAWRRLSPRQMPSASSFRSTTATTSSSA